MSDDNEDIRESYKKIDESVIREHYGNIKKVIDNGLNMELFNKRTANALLPKEPKSGRLYGLVKDHKPIPVNERIPPLRPVISGCGSNTEKISEFLDHYLKPLVRRQAKFPDFRRGWYSTVIGAENS